MNYYVMKNTYFFMSAEVCEVYIQYILHTKYIHVYSVIPFIPSINANYRSTFCRL